MPTLKTAFDLVSSLPSIWDTHRHLDPDYLTAIKLGTSLADEFGFGGVLLHYNLHAMEPWPVVAVVLENTKSITPLIAAQPTNLPPHTTARLCMTAASLFKRRVDLNFIAGAKPEEQRSVGDTLSHDEKYERLDEYGRVLRGILTAEHSFTHAGKFYTYDNFQLIPPMNPELMPRLFVGGSSPAALALATAHADVLVSHPQDVDTFGENIAETVRASERRIDLSIRVGIIARDDRTEAQAIALERFPQDRRGELTTKMKLKSESTWIKHLAEDSLEEQPEEFPSVFWLGAYRSGRAYCPYLVGTYQEVADALSRYYQLGSRVLLVDGPDSRDDFAHLERVLSLPLRSAAELAA